MHGHLFPQTEVVQLGYTTHLPLLVHSGLLVLFPTTESVPRRTHWRQSLIRRHGYEKPEAVPRLKPQFDVLLRSTDCAEIKELWKMNGNRNTSNFLSSFLLHETHIYATASASKSSAVIQYWSGTPDLSTCLSFQIAAWHENSQGLPTWWLIQKEMQGFILRIQVDKPLQAIPHKPSLYQSQRHQVS